MPTYTYFCNKCDKDFELFYSIKDYDSNPKCLHCNSKKTNRLYAVDVATQFASVKKSDSELKTVADLAQRNTDKLSDDEKINLYRKHNSYKYENSDKELPTGMSRVKKPEKIKWPGSQQRNKRKPKK
jgi:putative FmdB family regulatory protein